jgi:hypothetical protein
MRDAGALIQIVTEYYKDLYGKYHIHQGDPKFPKTWLDSEGEIFVISKDFKTSKFYIYHVEDLGLSVLPLQKMGSGDILPNGVAKSFNLNPEYDTQVMKDALVDYAEEYYDQNISESYYEVMHMLLSEHELPLQQWNDAQKKLWERLVTDGAVSRNDPQKFYEFGKKFNEYYHRTGKLMSYRQALIALLGY